MATPKLDELRDRLRAALTADKKTPLVQTANEMTAIRRRCQELGFDYNKLLTAVCQALSAERKTEARQEDRS